MAKLRTFLFRKSDGASRRKAKTAVLFTDVSSPIRLWMTFRMAAGTETKSDAVHDGSEQSYSTDIEYAPTPKTRQISISAG